MARQTRFEIEQALLKGSPIIWGQGSKSEQIVLKTPAQRRLFEFVLSSDIREIKGLPESFIVSLADAFAAQNDPASAATADTLLGTANGPWRLTRLETEGFGGINTWKGPKFEFEIDSDSLIIEGPNGSGKSSLVGALTWAFREKRIRDADSDVGSPRPSDVFDTSGSKIGAWPPIACYPDKAGLSDTPSARVKLVFANPASEEASVERVMSGASAAKTADPRLKIPDILIETGLMMPARLAHMRFSSDQTQLVDAVQMLTGLDEITVLGDFVANLAHKSREYLGYAKAKSLDVLKTQFTQHLAVVDKNLQAIGRQLPVFAPKDAIDVGAGNEIRWYAYGMPRFEPNLVVLEITNLNHLYLKDVFKNPQSEQ
jgi:hypothetical protein